MRTMFSRLLFAITIFALAGTASAGIILSIIGIAPPPLPIYEQPLCPGDGYIWTPGYWAYGDDGFFWVPGTWVLIHHGSRPLPLSNPDKLLIFRRLGFGPFRFWGNSC